VNVVWLRIFPNLHDFLPSCSIHQRLLSCLPFAASFSNCWRTGCFGSAFEVKSDMPARSWAYFSSLCVIRSDSHRVQILNVAASLRLQMANNSGEPIPYEQQLIPIVIPWFDLPWFLFCCSRPPHVFLFQGLTKHLCPDLWPGRQPQCFPCTWSRSWWSPMTSESNRAKHTRRPSHCLVNCSLSSSVYAIGLLIWVSTHLKCLLTFSQPEIPLPSRAWTAESDFDRAVSYSHTTPGPSIQINLERHTNDFHTRRILTRGTLRSGFFSMARKSAKIHGSFKLDLCPSCGWLPTLLTFPSRFQLIIARMQM